MGKLTDRNKIDIVEQYKTGKYTLTELGKMYCVTRSAIGYIIKSREPELQTKYYLKNRLSLEMISDMIDNYNINKSCKEIGKKYNLHRLTVSKILKNNGVDIKRRKFTINESYFNEIDTEEKAYFLGLLYADGCNHEEKGVVSIALMEEDREILDILNIAIGSNKGLYFHKRKKLTHKNQYGLVMCSKNISEKLAKLGCFERKSLTLKFPTENQVPKYLLRHFIRGYHDGDGCITFGYYGSRRNDKYFNTQCNLVSTQDFCNSFKEYMKNEMDINVCVNKNPRRGHNIITRPASVNGNAQCSKYLEWLYSDATIYLQRKYDKYQEFKRIYYGE